MNWLFLLLGVMCLAYYLICGFGVRFGQSMLWVWPAAAACFFLRFAIVQISIVRDVPLPFPPWLVVTFRCVCALAFAFFLLVEGFVFRGCLAKCPDNMDYLIILGAKTGSKALNNRIEAAAEYLKANADTVAVASGGKGKDEEISEAMYIYDGLIKRGIARERIIIEEQSKSTSENLKFTRLLISDGSVAIVSNDFHISRARCLARKSFNEDVNALPVRSSWISFPHYMVREFFTVVVDTLRGNMEF